MNKIATLALALALVGCADDTTTGSLDITTYGEEFIEDSIPSDEFVDGWTVSFDRFLISVGDVRTEGARVEVPSYKLFDLAQSSGGLGHLLLSADVDGDSIQRVAYATAPSEQLENANAAPTDLGFMTESGYAVYVEGMAMRGNETKEFSWGFLSTTRYQACEPSAGDVSGRIELTIHGDHLFYDMLTDAESNVAFDLIASADRDGDDVITEAELRATSLATEARYQVGSLPVDDLWTFMDYQVSTLGHINGEGHCETRRL
ncbi:MAG: hypothetical protein KJO07_17000 [Deltaproteobacteria bacterium]|nr:hypothetical protein [Deltaproteobacteria bacterium]